MEMHRGLSKALGSVSNGFDLQCGGCRLRRNPRPVAVFLVSPATIHHPNCSAVGLSKTPQHGLPRDTLCGRSQYAGRIAGSCEPRLPGARKKRYPPRRYELLVKAQEGDTHAATADSGGPGDYRGNASRCARNRASPAGKRAARKTRLHISEGHSRPCWATSPSLCCRIPHDRPIQPIQRLTARTLRYEQGPCPDSTRRARVIRRALCKHSFPGALPAMRPVPLEDFSKGQHRMPVVSLRHGTNPLRLARNSRERQP